MKQKIYFHGDVVLIQQKTLPKNLKKKKDYILREGELTGHAHIIEEIDKVELFQDNNGDLYLEVKEPVEIKHQQHSSEFININTGEKEKIKPGIYLIPYNEPKEYNYFDEEAKRVQD